MSPMPVTYGDLQTTIHGTLKLQSATPSERLPIPGKTIDLAFVKRDRTKTKLGQVTTADDGTFSLTTTLPTLAYIDVTFPGDTAYAPYSGTYGLKPAYLPTRVTLDALPAKVTGQAWATATGSVQMQTPDGSWIPATDAQVIVSGQNSRGNGWTGADGRFSTGMWISGSGPFNAISEAQALSFAGRAHSADVLVDFSPGQTRITGFSTPTPAIAQNGLTFTGRYEALINTSSGPWWSPGGGTIHLYFRAKGTTAWTDMGSQRNRSSSSTVSFSVPAYLPNGKLAEGSWQMRSDPDPYELASSSSILTVDVRAKTWLKGVKLKRTGTLHFLDGILDRNPTSGPVPGQTIKLYFKYRGGHYWNLARTAKTGTNGAFALKLTGTHRWYKAVFSPTPDYWGVTSQNLYFSS
jgi:hypothetical protein